MALGTGLSFQYWDTTANKTKRIAVDDSVTSNVGRFYQAQVRQLYTGGNGALNIKSSTDENLAVFNDDGSVSLGVSGEDTTVAGNLVVTGNVTVNGTTTTVTSTEVTIGDNIIFVNSGPGGSKNAGYASERYQTANDAGTGDVVTDANALVSSIADIGDQTGMSSTQIKLAGGSATNDYYVGMWLKVTSGASGDQVRKVTAYNGTTKVATVASAWTTQNPADNDAVSIYSGYQGIIYDETANRFVIAHLTGPAASNGILDAIDLEVGALAVDDLATLTGGASLPDSANLKLGNSDDLTLVHNGTNSVITSTTGDFGLENTNTTGNVYVKLGTNGDTNTNFVVKSSTSTQLLAVRADGRIFTTGGAAVGPSGGNLILVGGMGGGTVSIRANGGGSANGIDISNGSGITSYQAFLPDSDSARNLGSSSAAWATAYVDTLTTLTANGYVQIGSSTVALRLPNLDDTAQGALAAVAAGCLVWNTTDSEVQVYNGSAWVSVGSGDTSGLTGTTNLSWTVNSDGGGSAVENAALILISDDGDNKDTGTLTYVRGALGGSNRADYGTWSFAANVQLADGKSLLLGADGDVSMYWDDGGSTAHFSITGDADFSASGDLAIQGGGTLNIGTNSGGDINIGTDSARDIYVGNSGGALHFTAATDIDVALDASVSGFAAAGGLSAGQFAYVSGDNELTEATASSGGHTEDIAGVYNGTGLVQTGPVDVVKPSGETWAAGDRLFVRAGASGATKTAPSASGTDVREIGRVLVGAINGTTTARILLDLSKDTVNNP